MNKYEVLNLPEYYDIISKIASKEGNGIRQPLWFRGHPYSTYSLIPSIMRKDSSKDKTNENKTYNTGNLREEYRQQNYKVRIYHLAQSKPNSKLEWQALYQHNFGKTRLLDWSESARTALSFALEAFLDPREMIDLQQQRNSITPTVWILNPRKLNQKVYEYMYSGNANSLIEKALYSLGLNYEAAKIQAELAQAACYFNWDDGMEDDIEINGILNLGVIDEYRINNAFGMKRMLEHFEFNPFFYLCLRCYEDALPVEVERLGQMLPPLAILHQYQSERIRAQRGVFTIFPNYSLGTVVTKYKRAGYDCRILEHQSYVKDCLYEIRILHPQQVARELLNSGERRTELYPENEYYVHTMEAETFHI